MPILFTMLVQSRKILHNGAILDLGGFFWVQTFVGEGAPLVSLHQATLVSYNGRTLWVHQYADHRPLPLIVVLKLKRLVH